MTANELKKTEARYQRASRRAEDARAARNAAVCAALAAGWTHAKISEATGLTRGRIGQIAATCPPAAETHDRAASAAQNEEGSSRG